MKSYPTLQALLAGDADSKKLFDSFTPDQQVALQEQRQNIHTRKDLEQFAAGFGKQSRSW